jgi:hypothetical protein
MTQITVGSKVFHLSDRYRDPVTIQEREVIGETSRSWILGPARSQEKIPKKDTFANCKYFATKEGAENTLWARRNCYLIGEAVSRCSDYEILKKIAEMVDYKERVTK